MTDEQSAALRRPFPAEVVGKLPKPTKKDNPKGNCKECGGYHGLPAVHLDYVGHAEVTDRLLDVDPTWTWEPVAYDDAGLPRIGRGAAGEQVLWIRLTVGGVTRLGVGSVPNGAFDSEKQLIGDCVGGGTLLATPRGPVPVEALRGGDRVATRSGWRPGAAAWKAHENARLLRLVLSDGSVLNVTANHRMFRANGELCYASELRNGAMLYSWHDLLAHLQRPSSSRASSTAATSDGGTTWVAADVRSVRSIEQCGKPITAPFLLASTSTTRTGMSTTTASRISKLSLPPTTLTNTPVTIAALSGHVGDVAVPIGVECRGDAGARLRARRPLAAHQGSIRRLEAAPSAVRTSPSSASRLPAPAEMSAPFCSARGPQSAPNAESLSWLGSPGRDSAPLYVVAVLDGGVGPAWDVEVDGRHEFLAGPALTHNSLRNASMRFGVALDLWAKNGLESEIPEALPDGHSACPRGCGVTGDKESLRGHLVEMHGFFRHPDGSVTAHAPAEPVKDDTRPFTEDE